MKVDTQVIAQVNNRHNAANAQILATSQDNADKAVESIKSSAIQVQQQQAHAKEIAEKTNKVNIVDTFA